MSLIVRADASVQMGVGHVMRCLALAQAWQDAGGRAFWVTSSDSESLTARFQEEGIELFHLSAEQGSVDDAFQTIDLAKREKAKWVVVDGYDFGASYQRMIKESGLGLLLIDDYGFTGYTCADFILNQNIHAHKALYQIKELHTELLLGTRYALLRREFSKWKNWERQIPEVARNVFVTLGGSDPSNVTLKIVEALQLVEVEGLEATIVAGGENPHFHALQSASRNSRFPIRLQKNAITMAEFMAWADVAIASVGSTSWELVFMRVPSLVIAVADKHHIIAEGLCKSGVSVNLGWHETLSPDEIAKAVTELLIRARERSQMVKNCRSLLDGEGVDRVLMHLKNETVRLRKIQEADSKLLWEWANDPVTRSASFSSDPIPWEQHVPWFRTKLADPNCVFYIAVDRHDIPVGQVRLDINGKEAVISVSIGKEFRGKGYGPVIINLASQRLFNTFDVSVIHAYTRLDNDASVRAFQKSGYSDVGKTMVCGVEANHLVIQSSG